MSIIYKGQTIAGIGGGGTAEDAYSTEEARIGTWIDGKPLYRRVFDATTPDVYGSPRLLQTIGGMDTLVYAYGRVKTSNTDFVSWSIPTYFLNLMQKADGVYAMLVGTGNDWINRPMTVIAEYTKTTD